MDVKTIKRIIYRLFPELTGGWHLPQLAKVVALPELPTEGDMSERFYPHYAADIRLLDSKLVERKDVPIMQAVPLPVPGIGDHAGRLEPPAVGAIVEVGFANGEPDKPFIRTVLGLGWKLPGIKEGESRYQQRKGVHQLIDKDGNFERKTDQADKLECLTQKIKVLENRIAEIDGNHTETVKGNRTIKAKNITEDADTIKFNGGKGVCTGASICPFMGKPHVDVSTTVYAGK
ncbi:hypothetical protein [Vibrio splendidus]|uniref:Gp5/Type VI secretion system Vgr protein OB-fold domain-containing protein n=1 Tax=Vibrio splendidus TaxID=29497 RepID=A0A2N7JNP5_VIBSP|nr:hypothetical protein [Vibrio splendidus]PMM43945.1 hypothetical protein BCT54_05495 [Vibrio splendidus]